MGHYEKLYVIRIKQKNENFEVDHDRFDIINADFGLQN